MNFKNKRKLENQTTINTINIVEDNQIISRHYYNNLNCLLREDNLKLNKTIINCYDENNNPTKRYEFSIDKIKKYEHMPIFQYENNKLISYSNEKITYNQFGLPTTYRDAKFVWENNNLIEIENIASYSYHNQNRTSKVVNNELTTFYFQGKNLILEQGKHLILYHYNNELVSGFTIFENSTVENFSYQKNSVGDITGIFNQNNELICKYYYDYLGNHICYILTANKQFVKVEDCSPIETLSKNYFIATLNPFLFHGFYFDKETGLYHHNNQYYDPEIGIYLNTQKRRC